MGYRAHFKGLKAGGSCCGQGTDATIDRTYPTMLNQSNNFREGAWNSFCDEIDQVLKPVRKIKNQTFKMVCFLFAMMFTTVLVIPIMITQTGIKAYLGNFWQLYIFSFLFLAPALVFCKMRRVLTKNMNQVYLEIKTVCLNRSDQFGDVNFSLVTQSQTNGKKVWYVRFIIVSIVGVEDEESDDHTEMTRTYSDDDNV